jgi:hypothetical protein
LLRHVDCYTVSDVSKKRKGFIFVFKKAKKRCCAFAATAYLDEEGIMVLRIVYNYLQFGKI